MNKYINEKIKQAKIGFCGRYLSGIQSFTAIVDNVDEFSLQFDFYQKCTF